MTISTPRAGVIRGITEGVRSSRAVPSLGPPPPARSRRACRTSLRDAFRPFVGWCPSPRLHHASSDHRRRASQTQAACSTRACFAQTVAPRSAKITYARRSASSASRRLRAWRSVSPRKSSTRAASKQLHTCRCCPQPRSRQSHAPRTNSIRASAAGFESMFRRRRPTAGPTL